MTIFMGIGAQNELIAYIYNSEIEGSYQANQKNETIIVQDLQFS